MVGESRGSIQEKDRISLEHKAITHLTKGRHFDFGLE